MMNKAVFPRLLSYVKPQIHFVILSLVFVIINISLTLWTPILVGNAIDFIIGEKKVFYADIAKIVIILVIISIISALFQWLMTLCNNTISYRIVKNLREEILRKLNHVPLKYIDATSHGDVISRVVNDIDQISDGLLQGFSHLFTGVITILGTVVFMFTIHPIIAIVVILFTPLSIFVASFIAKHTHKTFKDQSKIQGELSGYVEELVSNQKLVTAFGYEERSEVKFEEINNRLYKCGIKAQFFSSMTNPCTRFVNGIVYAAAGVIGAIIAIKTGTMSIGQISSFLTYANQYTKPFNEITGIIAQLQSAFASALRVFAVIDEPEEVQDNTNILPANMCNGKVDIENVNFSYIPERKLIQDLNLHVKPGNRIAIVGPTGCGKTTLINLLMRFYDVNSGAIKVENNDIRDLSRSSLRSLYGMVLQETWLFNGTIRDNISYGKPDATLDEVIIAAKAANIHNVIKRMPNRYDTIISEDGSSISQGQKQLLCIARIMLSKPPMLILDEATSSIDAMTEIRIQNAFSSMMEGCTSFVVAHRLSTIREADVILVMKEGNIIEQGTHNNLLAQKGFYANLYQSQFTTD